MLLILFFLPYWQVQDFNTYARLVYIGLVFDQLLRVETAQNKWQPKDIDEKIGSFN